MRSQAELPPYILEEYRRAGEVWLHEQVAHNGLRAVFGSDKTFDAFLSRNAKHFDERGGLGMEERLAEMAEKMDVGKALTPQERTVWGRFVAWVRGWLIKHGWATPKQADLHNLLRDSLVRMSREKSGQGAERGARFSAQDRFIAAPHGGADFGHIPQEVAGRWGGKEAPIRLERGDERSGAIHILKDHGDQIRKLGYRSIQEFVSDVVNGFDAVFKGEGRSIFLAIRGGKQWRSALVKMEYDPDGDFYTVKTATPIRSDYFVGNDGRQKKRLLWERAQTNHPSGGTPGTPGAVSGQRSLSDKNITPPPGSGKLGDGRFSVRGQEQDYQRDRIAFDGPDRDSLGERIKNAGREAYSIRDKIVDGIMIWKVQSHALGGRCRRHSPHLDLGPDAPPHLQGVK